MGGNLVNSSDLSEVASIKLGKTNLRFISLSN